jgi:hypothetical protein
LCVHRNKRSISTGLSSHPSVVPCDEGGAIVIPDAEWFGSTPHLIYIYIYIYIYTHTHTHI